MIRLQFLSSFLLKSIFVYVALARLEPIDFSKAAVGKTFNNLNVQLTEGLFSLKKESRSDSLHDDYHGVPFMGIDYHSGYIPVGKENGEMFYLYFPSENKKSSSDTPFIIWLTGGPGCSSELAALTENGPVTIQANGTETRNPYSWTTVADAVYIDQPLGTGFSCVGDSQNYVTDEKMVAKDMREFLVQFIEKYPNLKNRPFFITGESYAGHYIPSVAHLLLKEPIEGLDLQGIAVGNGWVDPKSQYPAYADFAREHNMVGDLAYTLAREGLKSCVELLDQGNWILAILQCNAIVNGLLGKKNPYDIRLDCEIPPMCYNTTSLDQFMNRQDVQRVLGVHKQWKECNLLVYALMLGDWVTETRSKVAELLENGKRVLIYNGDQDFICNWRGGEAWVNNIEWTKQEEFQRAPYKLWNGDGRNPVAAMKQLDNLTFMRIYDAGHMVPMDQPQVALSMISSFFTNKFSPSSDTEDFRVFSRETLFDKGSMIIAMS